MMLLSRIGKVLQRTVIDAHFLRIFHTDSTAGAKALNALVQAGIWARERRKRGQDAAFLLAKGINSYIKWSVHDAKWKKEEYIPLIVINPARKNEKLKIADARGQRRVRKIAQQYKDLWDRKESNFSTPLPTIFHVFIAGTVMGFEGYNSSAEVPEFRSIFLTDWRQLGHDIWNAMAVAILVEQCRAWLAEVNPRRPDFVDRPETDQDL